MKNQKIEMDASLEQSLQRFADNVALAAANKAADEITERYKWVINKFYNSYKPDWYRRTYNLRDNSFKKYVKNSHKGVYYGGVSISSEYMEDSYKKYSPDKILDFALEGFHGSKSLGIRTTPYPQKYMYLYRDKVAKTFTSKFSTNLNELTKQFII